MELIAHGTLMDKIQAYSEIAADYLKEHPMIVVDTLIVVIVGLLYYLLFGWTKTKQTPAENATGAAKPQGESSKPRTAEAQYDEDLCTAAVESKDKDE